MTYKEWKLQYLEARDDLYFASLFDNWTQFDKASARMQDLADLYPEHMAEYVRYNVRKQRKED